MHSRAERWLGILASGMLVDHEDEEAAEAACKVVGEDKVSELREWFAAQTPETRQLVEAAVIEGCIAMMHADRDAKPEERALVERVIDSAHLDAHVRETLGKAMAKPPRVESIPTRVAHPVLRELLLVLAWELAKADGKIEESERGEYGVLAALLSVDKERAAELRKALGE